LLAALTRTLLVLAPLAVALPAAEPAPATPLRVLTYNLHHGEGVDGKLDLPRIAAVITAARADVVALQEVDQNAKRTGSVDQAAELGRLTGLHVAYGKAMDFQGGAYGQALLSRWPFSDFTVHPLPNPAKVEPRIAISATVRPPGQPAFRFVGTHLDATRDDTARWQQAARLVELFGADATPTLLVGDFNARPETRIIKALLQPFADASAASPAPTIPAEKPTGRIDFVLLRPANTWHVLSSKVIPESVASDHRPLLVELMPSAKPEK
jgi:endonuclease/exonuclease/phosphatase family metal-dependent hydrolase